MISEITASITAIKTSLELLKVISDAKSEVERQNATLDLSRQLTELQIENLRLAQLLSSQYEEITSLNRALSDANEEKREFERYTEYKTGAGQFIYAVRDTLNEESAGAPYACPNCYHQRQISILQPLQAGKHQKFHKVKCPLCGCAFLTELNECYEPPMTMRELGAALNGEQSSWLKRQ